MRSRATGDERDIESSCQLMFWRLRRLSPSQTGRAWPEPDGGNRNSSAAAKFCPPVLGPCNNCCSIPFKTPEPISECPREAILEVC